MSRSIVREESYCFRQRWTIIKLLLFVVDTDPCCWGYPEDRNAECRWRWVSPTRMPLNKMNLTTAWKAAEGEDSMKQPGMPIVQPGQLIIQSPLYWNTRFLTPANGGWISTYYLLYRRSLCGIAKTREYKGPMTKLYCSERILILHWYQSIWLRTGLVFDARNRDLRSKRRGIICETLLSQTGHWMCSESLTRIEAVRAWNIVKKQQNSGNWVGGWPGDQW